MGLWILLFTSAFPFGTSLFYQGVNIFHPHTIEPILARLTSNGTRSHLGV
jgi:hypothetical protein